MDAHEWEKIYRPQFEKLGCDRVRYLVEIGALPGNQQRRDAAVRWLRDQEASKDAFDKRIKLWGIDLGIEAIIIAVIAFLASLR